MAYGDSDWATCVKTRRSFSGICILLAGGTIAYKTKFQPTVALSSTEAEFMAATDVGRMCLYVRSILWNLDIPQEAATVAYEAMAITRPVLTSITTAAPESARYPLARDLATASAKAFSAAA